MTKSKPPLSVLKREYDTTRPRAERLLLELQRQVGAIVDASKITLAFPVETRIKSWESILSKRRRNSLRLRSVTELPDLCGLRVITLFRRDAEMLAEQIAQRFSILAEEDTGRRLSDDRFGYLSLHLAVALPEAWLDLPTLRDLAGLHAEIQVRSVAQHLWAAASHTLQYKTEASVPPPVKRSLSRVSALLETVDLELARVVEERIGYRETVGTKTSALLNADALEKTLDAILPKHNRDTDEFYEDLLEELLYFEIDTPLKLRALLREHLKPLLAEERRVVTDILRKGRDYDFFDGGDRVLEQGVYYAHSGFVRIALGREFGAAWVKYSKEKAAYLHAHYPLGEEDAAPTGDV
jgi:ppGpp synthetase/RelA/SpoT-type nucleotidyltranferase